MLRKLRSPFEFIRSARCLHPWLRVCVQIGFAIVGTRFGYSKLILILFSCEVVWLSVFACLLWHPFACEVACSQPQHPLGTQLINFVCVVDVFTTRCDLYVYLLMGAAVGHAIAYMIGSTCKFVMCSVVVMLHVPCFHEICRDYH